MLRLLKWKPAVSRRKFRLPLGTMGSQVLAPGERQRETHGETGRHRVVNQAPWEESKGGLRKSKEKEQKRKQFWRRNIQICLQQNLSSSVKEWSGTWWW